MNKILVIDDEEDFGYFVKANLLELNYGYHVNLATDGEAGLKIAEQIRPDLILLDINMPKMDGLQVLRKLKANTNTQNIPVIMLTARYDDDSITQAVGESSAMYIVKPIAMSTLEKRIQYVLRSQMLGLPDRTGILQLSPANI
jgi:DNA-binding response OmpR family regulator